MLLRTKKAVFARKVISLTPQKGIFLPKTSLKQPKAPSNKSAFKKNCQQQNTHLRPFQAGNDRGRG